MKRISLVLFLLIFCVLTSDAKPDRKAAKDREFWVATMEKICTPVLENLSNGTLRENMPVENYHKDPDYAVAFAHLEVFGRTLTGIAPWLELGPDDSREGRARADFIMMTCDALKNCVDPQSPDCLNFCEGRQPLVDAAFLAHGLLRCRTQVWDRLDTQTQERLIAAFKSTRVIKPHENNWLLFAAMVECLLKEFGAEWEYSNIENALDKHEQWYKGDGWYGDGPNFHFDYYNSFVIQPMIVQVLEVVSKYAPERAADLKKVQKRYARFAEQQERLISPEGTFPAIGRSLPYRFGAFYALSDVSYRQMLPSKVAPAQVRGALTAVMKRQVSMPGTFNKNGWLQIGFAGHQPSIGERYINTGSLYLCSAVFVALGLPADSEFWAAPAQDWTQKKVWKGVDVPCDKALKEKKAK